MVNRFVGGSGGMPPLGALIDLGGFWQLADATTLFLHCGQLFLCGGGGQCHSPLCITSNWECITSMADSYRKTRVGMFITPQKHK